MTLRHGFRDSGTVLPPGVSPALGYGCKKQVLLVVHELCHVRYDVCACCHKVLHGIRFPPRASCPCSVKTEAAGHTKSEARSCCAPNAPIQQNRARRVQDKLQSSTVKLKIDLIVSEGRRLISILGNHSPLKKVVSEQKPPET